MSRRHCGPPRWAGVCRGSNRTPCQMCYNVTTGRGMQGGAIEHRVRCVITRYNLNPVGVVSVFVFVSSLKEISSLFLTIRHYVVRASMTGRGMQGGAIEHRVRCVITSTLSYWYQFLHLSLPSKEIPHISSL